MEKADLVIVGGGIIGCATAHILSLNFPCLSIVVIEKNGNVGLEASGNSSCILHSGFHHPVGSLKERLANRGSKMAKNYARRHDIPLLECGMLITVPKFRSLADIFSDIPLLRNMYRNAKDQNLQFRILGKRKIRSLEPNVEASAGIFLPDVSVIDAAGFVRSLTESSRKRGVNFIFRTDVSSVKVANDSKYGKAFVLNGGLVAGSVINCSGLGADVVAGLFGLRYEQTPVAGEYYEITGEQSDIVGRIVSPAVVPGSSSKGILFSPRTDGRLFVGPNFRSGIKNIPEDERTPSDEFFNSVRRFVPGLRKTSLRWSHFGVRSKLSAGRDPDFVIRADITEPLLINNIGIDSPGLSSALAVAEMNCGLFERYQNPRA